MAAIRPLVPLVLAASLSALIAACDNQEPPAKAEGQSITREGTAYDSKGTGEQSAACADLPSATELKEWLKQAPEAGEAGGLFSGRMEWAAVVNREGQLCAVAASTEDPAAIWHGSLAIAQAKAYTANAFSTDMAPMSTARLYTMSQPGQSLWGAGAGNPFNPACLTTPSDPMANVGKVCGGTIVFGGGLALYKGKTRIGGLGASGDTPCADHEIAKRIREAAKLVPDAGPSADEIVYASVDGPSVFAHPLCPNTWRNGKKIGEANPVQGYQQLQLEVQGK